LRASDKIDELGQRQLGNATDEIGNETGETGQGVHEESAGYIRIPDEVGLLLKGVDEGNERNPVVV
jgi:hypothetical protein